MKSVYAPLTFSPHTDVPLSTLSPREQAALYYSRSQEHFTPWTVERVLREVYRRDFLNDLTAWLTENQRGFRDDDGVLWKVKRLNTSEGRLLRMESVLEQDLAAFCVEFLVEARLWISMMDRATGERSRGDVTRSVYRLRYCFDFRPEILRCDFVGVIEDDASSLLNRFPGATRLNEYLLPVMEAEDYSAFASTFRTEFLGIPAGEDVPLSPIGMAEYMGVPIREGRFDDDSVLGAFFFSHSSARIMDPESGMLSRCPLDPGTVVLSSLIQDRNQRGQVLVHELSHKVTATVFFMLQKTHGHKYCSYMCARKGYAVEDDSEPIALMERQAEIITGHLMIPTLQGRLHAAELMASYGGDRSEENLKRLVCDMARFYGTTKALSYRRLVDFGYTELLEIVRRSRVRYHVSEHEALEAFRRSADFQEQLSSGRFLYVDGVFCLRSEECICRDRDGTPHLTPWAQEHLSLCCLAFRVHYDRLTVEPAGAALSSSGQGRRRVEYVGFNGESPVTREGKELMASLRKQRAERELFQPSFSEMTVSLMRQRGMTEAALVEASGLSRGTVSNLRNNPHMIFPIQTIVAFCIALHLDPQLSHMVVEASPSKFGSSDEMLAYKYALDTWYMEPVAVVNRRLVEAGAPPLTSLVDGFDESGRRLA